MVILEKMADINFFKFESLSENFAKLYAELGAGNSCSVFGVQNSMRPAMVSNIGKKCLFLTADLTTANFATEQFELMGLNAILFPSVQDSFLYKKAQSIMFVGDKENANSDSTLVSTKRCLVFNQLNKELYQMFQMNKLLVHTLSPLLDNHSLHFHELKY